jgi:hypothetical protein
LGHPFQDRAEITMQRSGDFAAFRARRERNAVNKDAESLGRFVTLLRIVDFH